MIERIPVASYARQSADWPQDDRFRDFAPPPVLSEAEGSGDGSYSKSHVNRAARRGRRPRREPQSNRPLLTVGPGRCTCIRAKDAPVHLVESWLHATAQITLEGPCYLHFAVSSTPMKFLITVISTMSILTTSAPAQDNTEFSVERLPPSVVKTVPQAGQTDVDPSLDKISVTFSKEMMTDRMWAVVQVSKDHFPKISNNEKGIHYLNDKRTCVVPVELQPDHTYVLWFNKGRFNSFRDTQSKPAVPYLLVFHTRKSE